MSRQGWDCCLAAANDFTPIFLWSLVLIGVVILLLVAAVWVKRWAGRHEDLGPVTGFSLSELRLMHQNGQLTQEEFDRAKDKIVQAARTVASKPTGKPPGPPRDLQ